MRIDSLNRNFKITASLVGSKSESNRALMICHYGGFAPKISNISQADDTSLLKDILLEKRGRIRDERLEIREKIGRIRDERLEMREEIGRIRDERLEMREEIGRIRDERLEMREEIGRIRDERLEMREEEGKISDERLEMREENDKEKTSCSSCQSCLKTISCQNAGTVFRFLVTALAITSGSYFLTGSDRMLKRPVKALVDSLLQLGADIEYQSVEGFPPLIIKGKNLEGGKASVNISQSSQYASSLLLAAPLFKNGLQLHLDGELTSMPYIDMTIKTMTAYGAKISRDGREISVEHSDYQNVEYTVEGDWSAASYWYELVALSNNGKALLQNLKMDSVQGDKIVAEFFRDFGVISKQCENGVYIEKINSNISDDISIDFLDNPDLFPAVIATCACLQINATFTGLKNLVIKESNRIEAMITELSKIGVEFEKISDDILKIKALNSLPTFTKNNPVVFDSHNDHRIAMSLAPLAMKIGAIEIENADVVSKSHPNFWEEIEGLRVQEV